MMSALSAFPLLAIVVIIYNVVVLLSGGGVPGGAPVHTLSLLSGATWSPTYADLLVVLGLLLLYVEIFKATRSGTGSILDHLFSMLLFVVCLLEFIALPSFGTSIFFFIMMMTFIDVVAGFTVGIQTARRDYGVDQRL